MRRASSGPAFVRVHRARGVGVSGDLPAREIDGLQSGADHLHRLIAGNCAERVHIRFGVEKMPKALRRDLGERVSDGHRTAQLHDVGNGIGSLDPIEPVGSRIDSQLHYFRSLHAVLACQMT